MNIERLRGRLTSSLLILAVVGGAVGNVLASDLVLQLGHCYSPGCATFSADGRQLATGSYDGTVILWDIKSGMVLRTFSTKGSVSDVVLNGDGTVLTVGTFEGQILQFDSVTGKQIGSIRSNAIHVVWLAQVGSTDSIISGSTDGTVSFWDRRAGSLKRSFQTQLDDARFVAGAESYAASTKTKVLLIAGNDGTAFLWDLETGKQLRRLAGHQFPIERVSLSENGETAMTVDTHDNILLWNALTGTRIQKLNQESGMVECVALTPNGKQALIGIKGDLVVYDVQSGRSLNRVSAHSERIEFVALSSDGSYCATGSSDKRIRLWQIKDGVHRVREFDNRLSEVHGLSLSGDDRLLLTDTRAVLKWDCANGMKESKFNTNKKIGLVGAKLSHDGKTIAAASSDERSIILWNSGTGAEQRTLSIDLGTPSLIARPGIVDLAMSDDGVTVAAGLQWPDAVVWNSVTGRRLATIQRPPKLDLWGQSTRVVLSGDGKFLAVVFLGDPAIKLVDTRTGKEVQQFSDRVQNPTVAAFDKSGKRMAIGARDGTLVLLEVDSGKVLQRFIGHKATVTCATFNMDGKLLLTGAADGNSRLWDVASGSALQHFEGHTLAVRNAALRRDGRIAITASSDGTIRFWEARTGRALCNLMLIGESEWLAVTPDGFFDGSNGTDKYVAERPKSDSLELDSSPEALARHRRSGLLRSIWEQK